MAQVLTETVAAVRRNEVRTPANLPVDRAPYTTLQSRIQAQLQIKQVAERERFARLINHSMKSAGGAHTLLADTGMELLLRASKSVPRLGGRILHTAMRLDVPKGLNHLPDELPQQAATELR